MSVVDLFMRAQQVFDANVRLIKEDHWGLPTPCTEWDVRALVNHLANENAWARPMLESRSIAEVGNALDGDLLGDDPVSAWEGWAAEARDIMATPGVVEATVHASFAELSGEEYIGQLWVDHLIHAWDLARAIGADEAMDPELAQIAYDELKPMEEALKASGAYGDKVEVSEGADLQTKLLAVTGRRA